MSTKRLFVSLELPASVTQRLAELDPHLRGVRWLAQEQMHLTLSFLGGVSLEVAEALKENLSAIEWKGFFLPLSGLGTFPGKGRPNTIWIGVGTGIRIFSNCTSASRKPPSARDSNPICDRFIRTSRSPAAVMSRPNLSGLFFALTPPSMPE